MNQDENAEIKSLLKLVMDAIGGIDIDEPGECVWCHKPIETASDKLEKEFGDLSQVPPEKMPTREAEEESMRCKNPKCRSFKLRAKMVEIEKLLAAKPAEVWYVLAMPKGNGFQYLYDDEQPDGERLEFGDLDEAKEERKNQDCSEAIGILEETRRWIELED